MQRLKGKPKAPHCQDRQKPSGRNGLETAGRQSRKQGKSRLNGWQSEQSTNTPQDTGSFLCKNHPNPKQLNRRNKNNPSLKHLRGEFLRDVRLLGYGHTWPALQNRRENYQVNALRGPKANPSGQGAVPNIRSEEPRGAARSEGGSTISLLEGFPVASWWRGGV